MTDRLSEEPMPERGVWLRARQRTADVFFSQDKDDLWTRRVDIALILLITINAIAVIVESVRGARGSAPISIRSAPSPSCRVSSC